MAEKRVMCVLDNGECPSDCRLHQNCKEIMGHMGKDFDPAITRIEVVFMDKNEGVTIHDVARAMALCKREPERTKSVISA